MIKAMKQWLEALEINLVFLRNVKPFKGQEDLASDCIAMTEETITSLSQAIAEAEKQEPAAVGLLSVRYHRGSKLVPITEFDYKGELPEGDYELYTQPQPKAEQDEPAIDTTPSQPAIDTTPQPKQEEQEPVFHLKQYGDVTKEQLDCYIATGRIDTHPQQRKPLTDEEVVQCQQGNMNWLPKHKCGLHLSHNEHRDFYETVEEFYEADCFVSPEEWNKAVAEDSVWVLRWYPETPIGFHDVAASTLEAIEAKLKEKNA